MLYTSPVEDSMEALPSPEQLKGKILIKARKSGKSEHPINYELEEEDSPAEVVEPDIQSSVPDRSSQQVLLALSKQNSSSDPVAGPEVSINKSNSIEVNLSLGIQEEPSASNPPLNRTGTQKKKSTSSGVYVSEVTEYVVGLFHFF